ncbi:uncharacterized protein LOC128213358 [Mya arenaria]|uniref:uncharacterized protein LOC128213358 n=1 Tax=Mya arenaria TaxID=6604 RepID=UPI0022E059CE|nr:uncharacterized protein LOC128213358 [Mya arenaria]
MSTKSSGFGARRQLSFAELPFSGRTFYIDVKSNAQRTKIIQRIQALGGIIESFLSKDISLLITDCHDNEKKFKDKNAGFAAKGKSVPLSRGQALLQKANHAQESSPLSNSQRLVQNAVSLGIKTQTVAKFFNLSLKHLAKVKADNKCHDDNDPTAGISYIKWDNEKENLPAFYIKIEDNESHYKPIFKEFENFPKLSYSGTDSPFETGVTLTKKNDNQQAKKKTTGAGVLRGGYCESCDHWYKCSLRDHINSEKHKEFVEAAENFRSLNDLTKSLPNITKFVNTLNLKGQSNELKNTVAITTIEHESVTCVHEEVTCIQNTMLDIVQPFKVKDYSKTQFGAIQAIDTDDNQGCVESDQVIIPSFDILKEKSDRVLKFEEDFKKKNSCSSTEISFRKEMSLDEVLYSVIEDIDDCNRDKHLKTADEVEMINTTKLTCSKGTSQNVQRYDSSEKVGLVYDMNSLQSVAPTSVYASQTSYSLATVPFWLNSQEASASQVKPANSDRNFCNFSSSTSFGDVGVRNIVCLLNSPNSRTDGRDSGRTSVISGTNSECNFRNVDVNVGTASCFSDAGRVPSSNGSSRSLLNTGHEVNRGSLQYSENAQLHINRSASPLGCCEDIDLKQTQYSMGQQETNTDLDCRTVQCSENNVFKDAATSASDMHMSSCHSISLNSTHTNISLKAKDKVPYFCQLNEMKANNQNPCEHSSKHVQLADMTPDINGVPSESLKGLSETTQEMVKCYGNENIDKRKMFSVSNPDYSNITEESNQGQTNDVTNTCISNRNIFSEFKIFGKYEDTDNVDNVSLNTPDKDSMGHLKARITEHATNSGSTIRNWLVPDDDDFSLISLNNTPVNKPPTEQNKEYEDNTQQMEDNSKVAKWIQQQTFEPSLNSELALHGFEDATRASETCTVALSQKSGASQGLKHEDIVEEDKDSVLHKWCSERYDEGSWLDSSTADSRTSISDCIIENVRFKYREESYPDDVKVRGINASKNCDSYQNSDNVSEKSGLSSSVTEKGIKISGLSSLKMSRPKSRAGSVTHCTYLDLLEHSDSHNGEKHKLMTKKDAGSSEHPHDVKPLNVNFSPQNTSAVCYNNFMCTPQENTTKTGQHLAEKQMFRDRSNPDVAVKVGSFSTSQQTTVLETPQDSYKEKETGFVSSKTVNIQNTMSMQRPPAVHNHLLHAGPLQTVDFLSSPTKQPHHPTRSLACMANDRSYQPISASNSTYQSNKDSSNVPQMTTCVSINQNLLNSTGVPKVTAAFSTSQNYHLNLGWPQISTGVFTNQSNNDSRLNTDVFSLQSNQPVSSTNQGGDGVNIQPQTFSTICLNDIAESSQAVDNMSLKQAKPVNVKANAKMETNKNTRKRSISRSSKNTKQKGMATPNLLEGNSSSNRGAGKWSNEQLGQTNMNTNSNGNQPRSLPQLHPVQANQPWVGPGVCVQTNNPLQGNIINHSMSHQQRIHVQNTQQSLTVGENVYSHAQISPMTPTMHYGHPGLAMTVGGAGLHPYVHGQFTAAQIGFQPQLYTQYMPNNFNQNYGYQGHAGFPNVQSSHSPYSPLQMQTFPPHSLGSHVAYNAVQTGKTKITLRKMPTQKSATNERSDLSHYWNVKKTGDCKLVFCANAKRKAEEETPSKNTNVQDTGYKREDKPQAKRQKCLVY